MAATENVLVPLTGFTLPSDLPWRVRFTDAVENHLHKLHAGGQFTPQRFFGYYFRDKEPLAVSGGWTVVLDPAPQLMALSRAVEDFTCGQYVISSEDPEGNPEFMLVHDRYDGACWLWRFEYAMRFVSATDPQFADEE